MDPRPVPCLRLALCRARVRRGASLRRGVAAAVRWAVASAGMLQRGQTGLDGHNGFPRSESHRAPPLRSLLVRRRMSMSATASPSQTCWSKRRSRPAPVVRLRMWRGWFASPSFGTAPRPSSLLRAGRDTGSRFEAGGTECNPPPLPLLRVAYRGDPTAHVLPRGSTPPAVAHRRVLATTPPGPSRSRSVLVRAAVGVDQDPGLQGAALG